MTATGSATVLPVSDLAAAIAFYVDVLGFREDFRFGKYAGVSLGAVQIHLNGNAFARAGHGEVYVFVDEVDQLAAAVTARGARVECPLADQAYGLRDVMFLDQDGNRLSFGCPVAKKA
ncbi:hypothetical protein LBMAG53_18070 [Planctomycetota bacterium]|nr:hypothetical protein LBMAG53_18070 [Planctomycetota bacterium]